MTITTEAAATQAEGSTVPEGVEFAHVDPRTLVVGVNVRADADLTPEFVGSVKQHGVLQAVRARRAEDGTLVVLEGQRRTLAAVDAQRATIPVQIVGGSEDEARRIIEQLAENDHRRDMRESHRTAAFEQLSLIGLSAAQIAKRTGTKKSTVASALTVAGSKVAAAVHAKYDLPLDVAAALAEFDDDPETVKKLTVVAVDEPHRFAHVAQSVRDERKRAAEVAAARDSLAAQNVTEVEPIGYDNKKAKRLQELRPTTDDKPGTNLTPEAHATCPGHAAYIWKGWDGAETVYVCTDWRQHGHADRYDSGRSTQPSGPMNEAEKAERRRVIENNKAWRSAEVVRRKWLAEFAQRKTAPKGAAEYIARTLATDTHTLRRAGEHGHKTASEWLGVKVETGYYPTGRALNDLITKATPSRAQHIALVLCLAAREAETGVHSWRNEGSLSEYLGALESWGYDLSDVEKIAQGEASKK